MRNSLWILTLLIWASYGSDSNDHLIEIPGLPTYIKNPATDEKETGNYEFDLKEQDPISLESVIEGMGDKDEYQLYLLEDINPESAKPTGHYTPMSIESYEGYTNDATFKGLNPNNRQLIRRIHLVTLNRNSDGNIEAHSLVEKAKYPILYAASTNNQHAIKQLVEDGNNPRAFIKLPNDGPTLSPLHMAAIAVMQMQLPLYWT